MTTTLIELCQRVRPELACLGELGRPLLDVVGVIERLGAGRDLTVLADPGFALDLLVTAGPTGDATVVGRVLDFLRTRADARPVGAVTSAPAVTIAEAVERYERGVLALTAQGTQHTYRTWTRRLVAAYGDRTPELVSAGDLTDLIAEHVLAGRQDDERRRSGRGAEENAVAAFRHLWTYLVEKGYATDNVANRLRKPTRAEPRRRGFTVEEAALLRQLARAGRDPLLDELTLVLPERLGLRRIELCRLRVTDVDLDQATVEVWGKGDKDRLMPIPPRLRALLDEYLEDRRPAHLTRAEWLRSAEVLLRRRPAGNAPMGRAAGRRRIEELFVRLQRHAPDLFARGDLSLHSYRHALGTWTDNNYNRAVTRAVLGHTSRRTPIDHYVHVPLAQVAEMLAMYEGRLLAQWQRPIEGRGRAGVRGTVRASGTGPAAPILGSCSTPIPTTWQRWSSSSTRTRWTSWHSRHWDCVRSLIAHDAGLERGRRLWAHAARGSGGPKRAVLVVASGAHHDAHAISARRRRFFAAS